VHRFVADKGRNHRRKDLGQKETKGMGLISSGRGPVISTGDQGRVKSEESFMYRTEKRENMLLLELAHDVFVNKTTKSEDTRERCGWPLKQKNGAGVRKGQKV